MADTFSFSGPTEPDPEAMPGGVTLHPAKKGPRSGQVWLSAEQKDLILVALDFWQVSLEIDDKTGLKGAAGYVVRRVDEVVALLRLETRDA